MSAIPIFLASDNKYAPYVATTIASICDNTKSFIDFYILDGGVCLSNKNKINELKNIFPHFSLEWISINVEKEFRDLKTLQHFSKSMYTRFLIPQLKPDLKKVIYLDVDIIALGDIQKLYDQELDGYAIGAIVDQGGCELLHKMKALIEMQAESAYFNSGVLLMDIKKWQEENIITQLLEIEKKYRDKITCPDQDILNKFFENRYKVLHKKFNVMFSCEEIIIRHFVGVLKPWMADFNFDPNTGKPTLMHNAEDFWKYAKMTPFNELLNNRKMSKEKQDQLIQMHIERQINSSKH